MRSPQARDGGAILRHFIRTNGLPAFSAKAAQYPVLERHAGFDKLLARGANSDGKQSGQERP
jgi:hypothetical protein